MQVDCAVYLATPMSGRDKAEILARARRVCEIFREYGLTPISPVVEENVADEPGRLINHDREKLFAFWQRDKEILTDEAHVMFWDRAEQKSYGCEREYGFNRYCLWKPTVIYVSPGSPTSVAVWEDDEIFTSVHAAAEYIVKTWGTKRKRIFWRLKMLNRTFIGWVIRQIKAWR